MHCPEASEAISMRIDHALPPEREEELLAHLRECPACEAERQAMERLDMLFSGVEMARPAPQFAEQVMVRVRRRRSWLTAARWSLVALLGLVVGTALCLVPLASPDSPIAELLDDPSLLGAVAGALVRGADLARTLLDAVGLILRAIPASPVYTRLVGLVGAAALLAVVWLRVVMRAARVVGRTS